MKPYRLVCITLACLLTGGCAALIPDAERTEIQQGNLLSARDIDKLEKGQTRAHVRELLGDPILSSPFRRDRWDYVYYRIEAGREVEDPQQLTLYFDKTDRLATIVNRYRAPEDPLPKGNSKPLPEVDTFEGSTTTEPTPDGPGYPGS